jgi:hypothetical protein
MRMRGLEPPRASQASGGVCREVAGSGFPPRFRVDHGLQSRFAPRARSEAFGRGVGAPFRAAAGRKASLGRQTCAASLPRAPPSPRPRDGWRRNRAAQLGRATQLRPSRRPPMAACGVRWRARTELRAGASLHRRRTSSTPCPRVREWIGESCGAYVAANARSQGDLFRRPQKTASTIPGMPERLDHVQVATRSLRSRLAPTAIQTIRARRRCPTNPCPNVAEGRLGARLDAWRVAVKYVDRKRGQRVVDHQLDRIRAFLRRLELNDGADHDPGQPVWTC